jgi:anti-sigma factor RsiW
MILVLATYFFKGLTGDVSPLAAEMVAKHQIYSRGEGHLQVRSSDSLEVASWLRERLTFPVRLPLLARPGEDLVGARLSSIADGQAAYLLYEWMGRKTSLFIFKTLPTVLSSGSPKLVAGVQFFTADLKGYPVVWWEDQERYYAAVSNSGVDDLIEFGLLCVKGRTF